MKPYEKWYIGLKGGQTVTFGTAVEPDGGPVSGRVDVRRCHGLSLET